jgi:hypothetical protein
MTSLLRCLAAVSFTLAGVASLTQSALGADLPTVSIDHLYYLQSRGAHLQNLKPDEWVDYCISHKLGGPSFESLYAQVVWVRVESTRLLKVESVPITDPYIRWLQRALEAYTGLLREEAQRIRNGLIREGTIATETLEVLTKLQQQAPASPSAPPPPAGNEPLPPK